MSELEALRQEIVDLTDAIRDLSLAVRLRDVAGGEGEEAGYPVSASQSSGAANWELVEDGTAIPGAPKGFLVRDVVFNFEEGPPQTPSFCIEAAKRHLTSSRFSAEDRARSAFSAGHWARAFWECRSPYRSTYRPSLPATHWILRKGSGFELIRVSSQKDCNQLQQDYRDIVFLEKVPSLTELHIFCAGAKTVVPPLWRWSASR